MLAGMLISLVGLAAPAYAVSPDSLLGEHTHTAGRAHAVEMYDAGMRLEQLGRLGSAMKCYQHAAETDSTLPDVHYRIGLLFATSGDFGVARDAYQTELRHDPGHVAASRELGLTFARLGQSDRAVSVLENLSTRVPADDLTWQALGFAYSTVGRKPDAERALRRAVEVPPDRSTEHRDLGVLLASLGRLDEARAEYRKAMALDPRDPSPCVNLGNLERRDGKLDAALAAYTAAEARDSSAALALQGQVEVLRSLNRGPETLYAYRRWLDLRPDDHRARLAAANYAGDLGRANEAVAIARDGVTRFPRSPDARLVHGTILEKHGRPREGLLELRIAEGLFEDPLGRGRAREMIRALLFRATASVKSHSDADSVRALGIVDSLRSPRAPASMARP